MGSRSGPWMMSNLPIRPTKNLKLANPAREQKELSIPVLNSSYKVVLLIYNAKSMLKNE